MIALYIIAGTFTGFLGPTYLSGMLGRPINAGVLVAAMTAFVGGVAGHLLFNLVYN